MSGPSVVSMPMVATEPAVEEAECGDADEPPERIALANVPPTDFRRASIQKAKEQHHSLLTSALRAPSTEDITAVVDTPRRRSYASNVSVASTADLTSDTGLSTPARADTPSPVMPSHGFMPVIAGKPEASGPLQIVGSMPSDRGILAESAATTIHKAVLGEPHFQQPAPKRKCISFACAAKPQLGSVSTVAPDASFEKPTPSTNSTQPAAVRRPCIRFACAARPTRSKTPERAVAPLRSPALPVFTNAAESTSPTSVRKLRSSSTRSSRSLTPRRQPIASAKLLDKRYITADAKDLQGEVCRFHEFGSDERREDDWVRLERNGVAKKKLTIQDTLCMEEAFRRMGKEAEEEAEMEEAAEDPVDAEEEDEAADLIDASGDDAEKDDDNLSGYGSDDDMSDGYNTDEDYGFGDSDDEEDDDLLLWTTEGLGKLDVARSGEMTVQSSFDAGQSDSSSISRRPLRARRSRPQIIGCARPTTPELPDSTDFVCGTLDEDRALEAAYLSGVAARKQGRLRPIPQDIDPSFPTSDPESDGEGDAVEASYSSVNHGLMHGDFEDLHHEKDRQDRLRNKAVAHSPLRRYHSPPPKRRPSPAPKLRGRSPRKAVEKVLAKQILPAAPEPSAVSPPLTPTNARHFKLLAAGPELTHTKSLPRAPSYFPQSTKPTTRRSRANTLTKEKHVRGAVDIVKGLEQKRQRRREKFLRQYCNRARKGLKCEKKPQPGKGAERMRELGLIMAGKAGYGGNYMLSI